MMMHPNCLDLDPHDGDIELLERLKLHFGFVPTQDKVGGWLTLGDVQSTLQAELATQREGACPSLRTFNLLRSALIASGTARDAVRTETPLDALSDDWPSRFLDRLGKQTALEMPSGRLAAMGKAGSILFMVGFVGSIVLAVNRQWQPALWLLIPMIVGVILIVRDKGRWPPGVHTLGDLAVRVAGLNHARLGEVRDLPETLWQRLTAIVAEQSDMPPQHMRSDTLLFAPRKSLRERLAGS